MNPLWYYFQLKYRYPNLITVTLFYLLLWIWMIFISAFVGVELSYAILIVLSLLYLRVRHMKIQYKGKAWIGAAAGILSMSLIFVLYLVPGIASFQSVSAGFVGILAYGIGLQLLACTGEELSFRNCIFQDMDRTTGRIVAAVASSAAFALMHLFSTIILGLSLEVIIVTTLSLFLGGMVLVMLYVYGGIINAIAFHFFWNLLEYTVFGLTPMESVLVLKTNAAGIISGAGYGPESSIIGMGVMALVLIALWYLYRKQSYQAQRKTAES